MAIQDLNKHYDSNIFLIDVMLLCISIESLNILFCYIIPRSTELWKILLIVPMGIKNKGLGRTRGAYLLSKIGSILLRPAILEVDADKEEEVDVEVVVVETKDVV